MAEKNDNLQLDFQIGDESFKEEKAQFWKELEKLGMDKSVDRVVAKDGPIFKKPKMTGYPTLDEKTEGLTRGINILAAPTSVGKSSLALNIASNLAKKNEPVIYISTEMSDAGCASKMMSNASLYNMGFGKAKSAKDFMKVKDEDTTDYTTPQMLRMIADTKEIGKNIFFLENNGICTWDIDSITEFVRKAVKYGLKDPVLMIDYIQDLPASSIQMNMCEKDAYDYAIRKIRELVNELGICVLLVSSTNRTSGQNVSMDSLSGTHLYEYAADMLLALTYVGAEEKKFDISAARQAHPRKLCVKVVKHRYNEVEAKIMLDFYSKYNFFLDVEYEQHRKELEKKTPVSQMPIPQDIDDDSLPFN